ncbi:MAG: MBL fold metallo-hydrolase [Polyangiales bacterium]
MRALNVPKRLPGGAAIACARALVAVVSSACFSAPRYEGPRTDHFDGASFRNLSPIAPGFRDVPPSDVGCENHPWPFFVETPRFPAPPARVSSGLRVTFVNHATVLVQLAGINVLTDPVWSQDVGPSRFLGIPRHKQPGIAFDALPHIDAVVISHNHYDHLDLPTLKRLAARDHPVVLAGLGTRALLEANGIDGGHDLDWWQAHAIGTARITFAPARHWSQRGLRDRNANLWGSFFIAGPSESVYFAGDTGAGPHFRLIRERLGAPTTALLPVGAYCPRSTWHDHHIDPAEAVDAHLALEAEQSVAVHWGTFQLGEEGIDDPVHALQQVLRERGIPATRFHVLENGESVQTARPAPPQAAAH